MCKRRKKGERNGEKRESANTKYKTATDGRERTVSYNG